MVKRTTGDHIPVLTAYTSVGYNTEEAHDLVREVRGQHPEVGPYEATPPARRR